MKTPYISRLRPLATVALLIGVAGLNACTSIGYRCPLDASDKPDSPTACAGMSAALAGAKLGTGGKTSVLVDDKGRIVPPEMLEGRPAKPLMANASGAKDPYRNASGTPAFEQPKVFQAWASSFVDANGNLHDGHHSWFTTPGRWAYGNVNQGAAGADNILRPGNPLDRLPGRVIPPEELAAREKAKMSQAQQAESQRERDKAALQTLSAAANSASKKPSKAAASQPVAQVPQSAAGVTAPAMQLND